MRSGLRARPWVGLDVGGWSIKLIALQAGVGGTRHWVAEVPVPRTPDGDPEVLGPEALAKLYSECFAQAGLSPRGLRGLTLGVSGADVIVKQIALPLLDDDEVAGALRFEARKHLPFDPQTMVIDFQILGRYGSEKRLDVLLAAVPQARLDRALAPLKLLGVEADIVDAAPLALTNALSLGVEKDSEPRVMLDLGHQGSYFTLYQRGAPFFSRYIAYGGVSVTRAISRALAIPPAEAEEWKLEAGSEDPNMRVDWSDREMQAVRTSLADELADELRRSLAFYRTLAPLPEPMSLWVSGATARLPGLAAQLSEVLDVPTLMFDPLDQLGPQHRAVHAPGGPQFALAYGLALRSS